MSEHYRRHCNRTALAGALAGELGSYSDAWPLAHSNVKKIYELAASGAKLRIPKTEKPNDRVFDSCVAQIGLLGPELADDLAYTYNNINAFRVSIQAASDIDSDPAGQAALLSGALAAMERANERGKTLPERLRLIARESYFQRWPWLLLVVGALCSAIVAAFLLGAAYGDPLQTMSKKPEQARRAD
ncbi:hypothetical protein EYS42_05075 [Aquabacterium lacunae]|uniref:Uncharacterized protein n=1 Tax=Aquabacterium lacunae TaxID=2528630 RepID=A0A4Q9H4S8_9BURK|nr:hypothetical protein [Aquabacterium lacunae]TBO32564.1 hypothetical protein EYS42_05075 [Aquabacterium lacunae]